MKNIYRINTVDGQSNLICEEDNMKAIQEFIDNNKWMSIDNNTSISTDKVVSIECIATVDEDGKESLLRTDEYTIKQINKYLKSIIK